MIENSFNFKNKFPFKSRWLNINGNKIHYIDEGSGTAILFLHGNPTWSFLYRNIIKDLKNSYRCIALDYPGFGFSEANSKYEFSPQEHSGIIIEFINELQLKSFILVIHDWGGPIGLSLAVKHPDKLKGLVIMNSWCWKPDLWLKSFSLIIGGFIGKFLILNFNFFVNVIMPGVIRNKKEFPLSAYTERFPDKQARIPTYIFPRSIRKESDWLNSINNDLHKLIDKPAEIIWGMKDPAFGRKKYLNKWKEIFPAANITQLENASHYIPEDDPETVIKKIKLLK